MYFSYNYRIVGTLFQGIVFLVGVFGNLMVVVVVARTKSMHSPTNCYLVSLALADSIVLLASVPQEIVSYYVVGKVLNNKTCTYIRIDICIVVFLTGSSQSKSRLLY